MALLVGAGAAGYYAVAPPLRPLAGLECVPAAQHFGEIGQGSTLEAAFDLTNNYPDTIEITDVLTGCSCRAATVTRKHLAAGEKAVVKVSWAVGTRRGEVEDTIWVTHTDSEKALHVWLPIRISATVRPDIAREPQALTFRTGQADVQRVKLSPGRLATFTASDPYATTRKLDARYVAETAEVEVRYTPSGEASEGEGSEVVVRTSSPNEPLMHIPVRFTRPQP